MATNEQEETTEPQLDGPVTRLVRVVHAAAHPNDQTPFRVLLLVVLGVSIGAWSVPPGDVISFVALLLFAVSMGVPRKERPRTVPDA